MSKGQTKIVGVVGLIFLALAVLKFAQGGNWIVWLILGVLFGGIGGIRTLANRRGDA